jgi:hypothetical protein
MLLNKPIAHTRPNLPATLDNLLTESLADFCFLKYTFLDFI